MCSGAKVTSWPPLPTLLKTDASPSEPQLSIGTVSSNHGCGCLGQWQSAGGTCCCAVRGLSTGWLWHYLRQPTHDLG
jgi:hypothetical protein